MGQRVKFTSPVGTAVDPHLNTPDTQFNPEGVVTVTNIVVL